MSVTVGIVDGGFTGVPSHALHRAATFTPVPDGSVRREPAGGRPLRHGEAVASLVLEAAPAARLIDARIASHRHAPTPAMVAAAIEWCVGEGARVVNLSLGLLEDRTVLREACTRALEQGVVLVAAAPARGTPVFPAAYPGVIAVSGDARCAPGQWSLLKGETSGAADWGCSPAGPGRMSGGASMATARFTGILAHHFTQYPAADPQGLADHLAARASWHGREYKRIAEIDS
ncbi:subtilisin-like serine protease QhpE [Aromatoleum petrolei]|uniref:S8 family serine peptidase n=1 Tax=Aromatoleum petrolei TaxID=76116 RepID=A0ABX1MWK6_9RHOO|nr:S8 family serine peptidase [Aromatoleum petrolei]NMF90354.1 S8 family serine peptidase [Aromatoleum petrolei]QTQ37951.1 Subtilase family protein [Aromatoleum petrolei]